MKSDSETRYGTVSRVLHWAMVALFLWQFGGMIMKDILGRGPVTAFWVGSHASIGMLLLLLALVRGVWALANRDVRPAYAGGISGLAARLGHLALYVLMFVVPALALLRLAGSGRPIDFFGLPISSGSGEKVEWMMAPANAAHGLLAWTLLALIVGHVLMALIHRYLLKEDILSRMAGQPLAEMRK